MIRRLIAKGRAKVIGQAPYARLGLTEKATDEDAKNAHEEITRFLKRAPESVQLWAESEIAAADKAYTRFSRPPASRGRLLVKRLAVMVAALAVAVGIGVGVYNMGGGNSLPESQEAGAAQEQELNLGGSEREQAARLMEKVRENPKDVKVLMRLGDIFFRAEDYKGAGTWMSRAVKLEPNNVTARLALGAAQFNLGGAPDARRQWMKVIELDPQNVEAYYDLGFLYLSDKPSDMAKAKKAWRKVIEIAPNSAQAKTVAKHLKRLKNPQAKSGSQSTSAPPLAGGK